MPSNCQLCSARPANVSILTRSLTTHTHSLTNPSTCTGPQTSLCDLQDVSTHSQAASQGSQADPKVLRWVANPRNSLCDLQDVSTHSQAASQGSLADPKVLRTFSQRSDMSVDGPASNGSFQFSKAFSYVGCLGDTKTATVYLARTSDGEYAIKVCP